MYVAVVGCVVYVFDWVMFVVVVVVVVVVWVVYVAVVVVVILVVYVVAIVVVFVVWVVYVAVVGCVVYVVVVVGCKGRFFSVSLCCIRCARSALNTVHSLGGFLWLRCSPASACLDFPRLF